MPFAIPDSWCIARIDDVAFVTKLAGFEYTDYIAHNLKDSGIPLFKGKNVQGGEIIYEFESYIPESVSDTLFRSQVTKKCLLTPYVGTIGNIGIHEKIGKFHLGSNVGKIEVFNTCKLNLLEEFVKYFLLSSIGYKELTKHKKATAQESISIDAIRDVYLPIPPLEEQKRIVAEIDKWYSLVDEIDNGKQDLQNYLKATKSKILSLAISGKLVTQDPNDEPAIELLKRINPSFVPCDTSHYENLPQGWTIAKVGEVANYINGRAFKPNEWEKEGLPIIRIQNLNDERASYNYSSASFEKKYLVKNGDLLFAWAASLGTYIWKGHYAWLNQHIFKVIPQPYMDKMFLYYSLSNLISDFYRKSHGSGMVHITKGKFENTPILIPSLNEQKRIVKRLEDIYSCIDNISAEL